MPAVVFAVHGCPAGWLGTYGNEWVATPFLDDLAAAGVVFDRHISDCPDPEAARRAWATGAHQFRTHGLTPVARPDLFADLRAAGVHTVLVRANHPDADVPAFAAGFAETLDARPEADADSPLDALSAAFPGLLARLASVPQWLVWVETDRLVPPWDVPQAVFDAYTDQEEEDEEADDEPTEATVDGEGYEDDIALSEPEPEPEPEEEEEEEPEKPAEEPATPWADPPTGPFAGDDDIREWLHTSFAAVVSKLDAELGLLIEQIPPAAAVVVTADYGLPLGDHGQVGPHRPWLHTEFVHLPLIVRLPDGAEAGRRVAALTQPADLGPTLLDLLGVAPPIGDGVSLLPLARGEVESVRDCAVTRLELGYAAEAAIRTDEWAFVLPLAVPDGDKPRGPMLFAKPDDRWEFNDLRGRAIDAADELEARLRAAIAPDPGTQNRTTTLP